MRLQENVIGKAVKEARAAGKGIELRDDDQRWLRLRVSKKGVTSWGLLCRGPDGRVRRFLIGSYPGLKLSEARHRARTLREQVRAGHDPVAERRRAREAREMEAAKRSGSVCLEGLLQLYGTKGDGKDLKSWPPARKRPASLLKPIADVPLCDLTLAELQKVIDNHGSTVSAGWAVRTVRPVLKWGAKPGRKLCSEELLKLSGPAKPKARQRVLDDGGKDSELGKVWRTLVEKSGDPYADCMRLILLTLMRKDEAAGLQWSEVDLEAGVIKLPETRTKNGKAHTIPLSGQAVKLLADRRTLQGGNGELVFPSPRGLKLASWSWSLKAVHAASGTKGWHQHDLRRTGSTLLGEMGILNRPGFAGGCLF